MSIFLDTNVLLYAALEPGDAPDKQDIARELLKREDCVLSMQVLQEFTVQAIRPTRPNAVPLATALAFVTSWRRFPVQETTLAIFDLGSEIIRRHKLSFWDSMIVAAARAQGCDILYSEDMQDGRIVDGMRIVNPFR